MTERKKETDDLSSMLKDEDILRGLFNNSCSVRDSGEGNTLYGLLCRIFEMIFG